MPTRSRPRTVTLRDGSSVVLRPIEPSDRRALARAHERLSELSRYKRFLAPMPRLTPGMLSYLTEVDHHDHEAIIAFESGSGDGLGVARYVRSRSDPEEAEVAFAVIDEWQGRGLGRALLDELVERARQEGVRRFTGLALADNVEAGQLLEGVGELARSMPSTGNVEVRVDLPAEEGIGAHLAHVLRAAAAGSVVTVGGFLHRAVTSSLGAARAGAGEAAAGGGGGGGSPISRIVVGTDGSHTAGRAVRQAAQLARRLGAELRVVSAYGLPGIDLPDGFIEVPDGLSDLGWLLASRHDAEAAAASGVAVARPAGVVPSTEVRRGDPATALIAAAEDHDADLIVVGSKGLRSGRRFLLGAVADRVSHHAPCSVLIARTD